jgi:predicted acetyltransferase
MTEFCLVPESDRRRYRDILRYAFDPQAGPLEDDAETFDEWPPELFDPHGLYEDGRLRSTCKLYDLRARLGDGYEQIGGLGAVATPPEDRRRGHVRELCRHALAAFEERGARLVALWPFETAFYEKFGWATANYRARYECPPAALPAHEGEGRMRSLGTGDWELLRDAESAHGETLSLSLRRSPEWWRERTLTDWDGGARPYSYGYERDGEIAGYLTYTIGDDEDGELIVETMAYADEEAYRTILAFLGTHGPQVGRIVFTRPESSNLLDRVDHPERIDYRIQPGPMVRLPGVSALDGLSWRDTGLDCSVEITDPLAEEPTTARIECTAGTLSVGKTEAAPAVTTDIGTLSQFAVGTRGIDYLRRLDRLEVHDHTVLDTLSATFEPRRVYLDEFF